ncbi:MAG: hypothetical protein GY756_17805 [bacterium]|nr:hypothetical protein [bacterium]
MDLTKVLHNLKEADGWELTPEKLRNQRAFLQDLVNEAEKQALLIHGVSVTLPNIDEVNIEVKKQLENIDEDLIGEITAYRYGFVGCWKWVSNLLTKGN